MSSSQSEDIYGHLTFTQNLHSSKKSNLYSKVTSNSRDDDFAEKAIAQANNKLQAAQTLLDRVGIAKTDTLNVNHQASNGIFIMPDKKEIVVEATKYEDIPD